MRWQMSGLGSDRSALPGSLPSFLNLHPLLSAESLPLSAHATYSAVPPNPSDTTGGALLQDTQPHGCQL